MKKWRIEEYNKRIQLRKPKWSGNVNTEKFCQTFQRVLINGRKNCLILFLKIQKISKLHNQKVTDSWDSRTFYTSTLYLFPYQFQTNVYFVAGLFFSQWLIFHVMAYFFYLITHKLDNNFSCIWIDEGKCWTAKTCFAVCIWRRKTEGTTEDSKNEG